MYLIESLNHFQDIATRRSPYPLHRLIACAVTNLAAETNEMARQYAAVVQEEGYDTIFEEQRADLLDELGYMLRHVAIVAKALGASLEEVAQISLTQSEGQNGN